MPRYTSKNIITRKHELPLDKGEFGMFLRLLTAGTVFLLSLTLAGVLAINSMIGNWNEGVRQSFTVQVMPVMEESSLSSTEEEVSKVVKFLEMQPEISLVHIFSQEEHEELIRPWLGDGVDLSGLPMPTLIDVSLNEGMEPDYDAMAQKLSDVSEYAAMDNHNLWLQKLIKFADALNTLAAVVLIIVALICGFSIYYATKTNLGMHKNIIEILHIMGAKDTYIAQQYAQKALSASLVSGVVGLLVAVLAINGISGISADLDGGIIKEAGLSVFAWIKVCSIPFIVSAISATTAYYAVKSTLGKLM